ncbi:MAG TPA: LemA family protein [Cyclobacteriaceae bacterium]
MKFTGLLILFSGTLALSISCVKQEKKASTPVFTRIDSLTDTYLALQDSMLHTWNVMMKDENEKLGNVDLLLQELKKLSDEDQARIESLEQRLDQLNRIRFTQKTMVNPHVVEEYDFASNSLISEVISIAESEPTFAQDTKLQQLTDWVKSADQRVPIYREEYDAVVDTFNQFLEKVKPYLPEIDAKNTGEKKVLFTSEEY